jgi:hypothetical protein
MVRSPPIGEAGRLVALGFALLIFHRSDEGGAAWKDTQRDSKRPPTSGG